MKRLRRVRPVDGGLRSGEADPGRPRGAIAVLRKRLGSPVALRRGVLVIGALVAVIASLGLDVRTDREAERRANAERAIRWLGHPEFATRVPASDDARRGATAPLRLSAERAERLAAALAAAEAEGRVIERAQLRRETGGRFTLESGGAP